jgi:pilus assembly protein Flp/PilA
MTNGTPVTNAAAVTKPTLDWQPQAIEMGTALKRLWHEEAGQDLVEYALVVALIGLASVAAMNNVAGLLDTAFSNAVANMSSTTT